MATDVIFSFLFFYRRHIIVITSIGAIAVQLFFFSFLLLLFFNCKPWLFKGDSIMHFFIIGSNYPLNQNLLFKYSLLFFPVTAVYCLISNYYRSVFLIHFRQDKFHAKGFLTNTSVAIVRRTLTL